MTDRFNTWRTHTHTHTDNTVQYRNYSSLEGGIKKKKKLGIAMYGMNRQWREGGREGNRNAVKKEKKKKAFSLDKD